MGRRDTHHQAVKRALIKDGWQITHDPFRLTFAGTVVATDLGAQRSIDATDGQSIAVEIIAVEVKDFDNQQMLSEFEKALGQFHLYRSLLKRYEPGRVLYLAVRKMVWETFFQKFLAEISG
jgi:hypothetical protein